MERKTKPVVGVFPLWDEDKNSLWMLPNYLTALEESGVVPIILPFASDKETVDKMVSICDGFLFTGGPDVDPHLYSEEYSNELGPLCPRRDILEKAYFEEVLKHNIPALGICRGLQLFNVLLGGSLFQDLPSMYPSNISHRQKVTHDILTHDVKINKDTPLYTCLGVDTLGVNSFHHQGIKELGDGLEIMAKADDDLVEAIRLPSHKFLWAVQWHPELLWGKEDSSRKIFKAFVDALGA